ncbi:hypothetical protein DICVIV_02572 [Dictyocaulus viviparus]|uniref:SXP/RAL-2 family protein Ani s 5-like cation-binding domain-containing protein n=1 Tax=Dictyocaulus viviparus TaxID=29172 RepID=A0A0D8Y4V9_DICVI|nr:hypothetical protein DICVIV_02572 [Dictyocaulus viviparus]
MLKIVALVSFVAVSCIAQGPQDVPPFLQRAPMTKQKEFERLMMNVGSMTDSQIDKLVMDWIGKQSPTIQSDFKSFMNEVKAAQAQGEAAHKAAIEKFSPEARAADAKLTAIAADPLKTSQQKGAEIDAFLRSLSPTVRMEIENAMRG